jgi:hypothetical protein
MKAGMISVVGLLLVLDLLSSPACAQAWPAQTDCDAIVRELRMRPPSYGDASRANYDWGNYIGFCEKKAPWNKMMGADDVLEVSKVLHPGLYK